MAELTNTAGLRIRFDPKAVTAVADHDDLGSAGTCVYGVMKEPQKIAETCDQFLTRLAIKANFVRLTRASGTTIWINVDAVDFLRERLATDIATVGSLISFGGTAQGLAQDYAAAAAALNAVHNRF